MSIGCRLIIGVSRAAACAGAVFVAVTEGGYISRLACIAACAGFGLRALCGAGRSFGLRPIAVAVAKGGDFGHAAFD